MDINTWIQHWGGERQREAEEEAAWSASTKHAWHWEIGEGYTSVAVQEKMEA